MALEVMSASFGMSSVRSGLSVHLAASSRYPSFSAFGPSQRTGMLPSENRPRTGESWLASVILSSSSALLGSW